MSRRTSILEGVYVGNGIEPTPHSLKIVNIVMWYDCIRKLRGHVCKTMRFWRIQKQTEQDNPCLWFLFYFTSQHGIRSDFNSNTTLRSHLVHPRDAADPRKQDGVVYEITYECSKVYIAEMGRWKHEWIKELERHIRLSRTQSSAVSERANKTAHYLLWDEVKFIDKDLHIVLLATLIRGGGGITSTRSWTGHLCQNKVQCLKYFCNWL